MKYSTVREIPLPEDLSELQKIEFEAFQSSLGTLEDEWNSLEDNNNPHQKECIKILDENRENRKQEALERLNLRLAVINQQVDISTDRVDVDTQNAKQMFYDRIMRAYYASYQNLLSQLQNLMSEEEYSNYIQDNSIDFPAFPDDNTMKTRMQESEALKIRISPQEIEHDLRKIQSRLQKEESE